MEKITLDLIKKYISNSNPKSTMKFKSLQEREVWLQNAQLIFSNTIIEDLNDIIDGVDFSHQSGSFFAKLYSDKLSIVFKDINIQTLPLIDVYNEVKMRVEKYKTNEKAIELINNIVGSSFCNFFRLYKDEEIIDLIRRNTEYSIIFRNFFSGLMKSYQDSEGKISYGISEYTMRNCLQHFKNMIEGE